MVARLSLQLLGPFRASVAGPQARPLALSAMRHRALMAYLASQVSFAETRERLATLIWGDSGDQQARQSLRQTLLTLRKELAEAGLDIISADRKLVELDSGVIEVDARDLIVSASGTTGRSACRFPLDGWQIGRRRYRVGFAMAPALTAQGSSASMSASVEACGSFSKMSLR